ncbi:hypothetical protein NLG97_g10425 [Lecanicillium saksenae]|uniref:Uncharacterized protein n=1 Tax=Lecanicillium saksenae TaxID=468837 RepID=A0ACC1QD87_9HYPO|nr:hypothetical protein NLG97_g10425 [Lecanicillium saksenae]
MAHQQPSLDAKKAFFTHFQTLPHSDDEGDNGVTGDGEPGPDVDELGPREQRMRHRHRRFFREAPPGHKVADNEDRNAGEVQATLGEENDDDEVVVVTSSTKATPMPPKGKGHGKRERNAVDELLGRDADSDVEIIGETPQRRVLWRSASRRS